MFCIEAVYVYKPPDGEKPKRPCMTYVIQCYRLVGVFLFGAVINQLATEMTKLMVGRLRPHFLAVCNPTDTVANSNCAQGIAFQCNGVDEHRLTDARYG
jgi:hypothetical protein